MRFSGQRFWCRISSVVVQGRSECPYYSVQKLGYTMRRGGAVARILLLRHASCAPSPSVQQMPQQFLQSSTARPASLTFTRWIHTHAALRSQGGGDGGGGALSALLFFLSLLLPSQIMLVFFLFASHGLFSSLLWGFAGWFWVSSFLDELFCLRSQFFCFIWSQLSASACPICFSFFVWEGLLWVLARRDKNNWRFLRKGRMWNMCKSYYNISAIRMCRSWFCGNSFGWCNYETMRKEFIHKKIPCCIEDESGIVWTSPSKGTRL